MTSSPVDALSLRGPLREHDSFLDVRVRDAPDARLEPLVGDQVSAPAPPGARRRTEPRPARSPEPVLDRLEEEEAGDAQREQRPQPDEPWPDGPAACGSGRRAARSPGRARRVTCVTPVESTTRPPARNESPPPRSRAGRGRRGRRSRDPHPSRPRTGSGLPAPWRARAGRRCRGRREPPAASSDGGFGDLARVLHGDLDGVSPENGTSPVSSS